MRFRFVAFAAGIAGLLAFLACSPGEGASQIGDPCKTSFDCFVGTCCSDDTCC